MTSTLCLIPAKGCSTRLPRKNALPINGQPLISRAIEKALLSELFDEVCVSTEVEEIAELARASGAKGPFMRPDELSRDPATITDVILHALEFYAEADIHFDTVFVILPTAPFVTADDLKLALQQFERQPGSVVMSVTTTDFPPYNAYIIGENAPDEGMLTPCFPDSPYKYVKSTECPATYRSNGAILILSAQPLLQERTYRALPLRPYIMPVERSLDIDTELEYRFAQFLAENDSGNRNSEELQ